MIFRVDARWKSFFSSINFLHLFGSRSVSPWNFIRWNETYNVLVKSFMQSGELVRRGCFGVFHRCCCAKNNSSVHIECWNDTTIDDIPKELVTMGTFFKKDWLFFNCLFKNSVNQTIGLSFDGETIPTVSLRSYPIYRFCPSARSKVNWLMCVCVLNFLI